MSTLRQAAIVWLRAKAAQRHGIDLLPVNIGRRRVYILPTRAGLMLAFVLISMLLAGLNYNSNLGLGFAFLMVSVALVTMHHCNRNLVGLRIDAVAEVDGVAGGDAVFRFVLSNASRVDRRDIEIRCLTASGMGSVLAHASQTLEVVLPVTERGIIRLTQFELRTRYPFGWYYAWTYVQGVLTAYIAPKPLGSRRLPTDTADGQAAPAESRGDEDFSGLQAYQPGMPLKHMAWKVLARGQEAAVRTYTGLGGRPEWLDWQALDGLSVEQRLSQLCRWVMESDSAQRPYGLRLPGTEIAPALGSAHRVSCLRALAVYGFAGRT